MKVAHLTPTYFSDSSVVGGGERYVHNLVRALSTTEGFEQTVLSVGPAEATSVHDGTALRILRNDSPRPEAMEALSASLAAVVHDYDLVHIHQCLTGFGAYCTAIARSAGVATVGTDLGGGTDALMMQHGGIELLDRVVSISAFAQRLLAGAYTGPADILIGPVDTEVFTPAPHQPLCLNSSVVVTTALSPLNLMVICASGSSLSEITTVPSFRSPVPARAPLLTFSGERTSVTSTEA